MVQIGVAGDPSLGYSFSKDVSANSSNSPTSKGGYKCTHCDLASVLVTEILRSDCRDKYLIIRSQITRFWKFALQKYNSFARTLILLHFLFASFSFVNHVYIIQNNIYNTEFQCFIKRNFIYGLFMKFIGFEIT